MRTRTPFIDAFRKQQQEKNTSPNLSSSSSAKPTPTPDLSPKTMTDSYHRVVGGTTSTLKTLANMNLASTSCTGSMASGFIY